MIKELLILIKIKMSRIPLIGGLVDCTLKDHTTALAEFSTTVIISLLPIIISSFIVDHYTKNYLSLWDSIYNNISKGELFLFSTSLLAPVFYTVLKDTQGAKQFPSRKETLFIYGSIMLLASIVFALQRANVILAEVNLFEDSIVVFVISMFLLYLVIVYNNNRSYLNPSKEMLDSEDSFVKKYASHRGKL